MNQAALSLSKSKFFDGRLGMGGWEWEKLKKWKTKGGGVGFLKEQEVRLTAEWRNQIRKYSIIVGTSISEFYSHDSQYYL